MAEEDVKETLIKEMGKMAYAALIDAGKSRGLFLEFCRHKDTKELVPVVMMILDQSADGMAQVQPIAILDVNLLDKVEPPEGAVIEHVHKENLKYN